MSITIQEESFTASQDDLLPLIEEHWEEVAWYKDDIKLSPRWDLYEQIESQNNLRFYTARDGDKLVGYTIFFIAPLIHYADHTLADNDIVYLDPAYRKGYTAIKLLKFSYSELKKLGVSVISTKMKSDHEFHSFMKHLGFDLMEYNYTKYVGEA